MLKGKEPVISQQRGIRMAEDGKNAALVTGYMGAVQVGMADAALEKCFYATSMCGVDSGIWISSLWKSSLMAVSLNRQRRSRVSRQICKGAAAQKCPIS